MSAPAPQTPERVGRVLGVAGALVALLGAVYVLATQTTRAVDARETLAAWFEPRELPGGLTLAEAQVLPRGDRTVRLARSDAQPEPARNAAEESAETPQSERFDWSSVRVGPSDTVPREVLVVELPLELAADELKALFLGGVELRGDWKSVPRNGGRRVLDRGTLPWGELNAPYVIEREFEPGATFRDVLRVNLTRERTPLVLFARWSRGDPASKVRAEELLAALPPRAARQQ